MKAFKVISEKLIFNSFYSLKTIRYNNKLSEVASKSPGFISSKSYFSEDINFIKDDKIKIITISEWNNKKSWEKWFNSEERKSISEEFKDIKRKEKFNALFVQKNDNIFLM